MEERALDPEVAEGDVDVGVAQGCRDRAADTPGSAVVLDAHHEPVLARELHQHGSHRHDPPRVHDGHADPLLRQAIRDVEAQRGERADRHEQDVRRVVAPEHVDAVDALDRGDVRPDPTLGEAHHGGGVGDLDRLPELGAQRGCVARRGDPQPGHDLQDRHVPHAVVARAVVAGDAGPVEHEGDSGPVQRAVHEHLVERSVDERRIQRDHRVEAGEGHARGARGRVLLGDPDVVGALGELRREPVEPRRPHHRGGDGHDVGSASTHLDELLGEHRRPGEALVREGLAGLGVEDPDGVEALGVVELGRPVAAALLGDDVHDDRTREDASAAEGVLEGDRVVAVDRADVLEPEVLEHALRREDVLDALLDPVQRLVERGAHDGRATERALAPVEDALVGVRGAQGGEVVREAADGG